MSDVTIDEIADCEYLPPVNYRNDLTRDQDPNDSTIENFSEIFSKLEDEIDDDPLYVPASPHSILGLDLEYEDGFFELQSDITSEFSGLDENSSRDDEYFVERNVFDMNNNATLTYEVNIPASRNDDKKCGSFQFSNKFKNFNLKVNILHVAKLLKLYFEVNNFIMPQRTTSNSKVSLSKSFITKKEAILFQYDIGRKILNCVEGICEWKDIQYLFSNKKNPSDFEKSLFNLIAVVKKLDVRQVPKF